MNGKFFPMVLIVSLISALPLYGQQAIDIAESVVKVGIKGEESVYFGFAEGDKIIFSFEETNGKEMKEIEIVEMPSLSRFMDVKTAKIDSKSINVPRKAIYRFRFANSALIPRICKYKIQRIPASSATQSFNSTVYIGDYYDTTYTTETESYIDRSDTVINNFQERVVKVNALTAPGSSKSTFNFTLPENTVAWSYYIYADKIGQQVYEDAAKVLTSNSTRIMGKFPKYNPVAAVAIDEPSYLIKLDTGQYINYWIVEGNNAELFKSGDQFRFLKKGKAVNDFAKMEPLEKIFVFCLHNDNRTAPVTVTVKITAILINEKLESRTVNKMNVITRRGMHLKN